MQKMRVVAIRRDLFGLFVYRLVFARFAFKGLQACWSCRQLLFRSIHRIQLFSCRVLVAKHCTKF